MMPHGSWPIWDPRPPGTHWSTVKRRLGHISVVSLCRGKPHDNQQNWGWFWFITLWWSNMVSWKIHDLQMLPLKPLILFSWGISRCQVWGLESIVGFPWVSFPVAWAPRCAPRVALLAVHLLVSDCNPLTGVELACKPIPNLWENGYVTVTKKTNGICWWCRISFVGKVPLIGNHGVCSQIDPGFLQIFPYTNSRKSPGNPIARWNTVIFWYVYSPALDYGPFVLKKMILWKFSNGTWGHSWGYKWI